jgi:hypothetical protein
VRQAQEGDIQGDIAGGLLELIAIVGRVVVIARGGALGEHGFGLSLSSLKPTV